MTADSNEPDHEFVMLLTSETQLRQRIGAPALTHYLEALQREVAEFFRQHPEPHGITLQVAVGLIPDRPPIIDLQLLPFLSATTVSQLVAVLDAVEVPAVWNGPAAFSFRQAINGGCGEVAPKFFFPFFRLCPPLPDGESIDDLLERCVRTREQARYDPWVSLFRGFCAAVYRWLPNEWKGKSPWNRLAPPAIVESLPPLPADPVEELVVPDLSPVPLDQLAQLIATFPDEVRHYWRRIQTCIENGDQAQVVRDCRDALLLEPGHPWTLITLVFALRSEDDSAGALSTLTGLIQSHPRIIESYILRAEIYAEIGAYDAMFGDLEQALRLSPRSSILLMRHARACSAMGRIDDAYHDLALMQRLDPHDSRIFGLRAYIRRMSSGNPDTEEANRALALADVDRALKLDPNCADAFSIRAEIRISQGNLEEAIEDCNRALKCNANYHDGLAFRGLARYRQRQFAEAAADWKLALERGCLLNFVRPMLAEVQHLLGDHESAIATLDTVLKQSPESREAQLHKAVLLLTTERPQEALELLDQIIERHPDFAVAYNERGKVRRVLLQLTDALDDFDTALRLGVADPLVRLNRALTLLDLERFEEALDEFTLGLKESPDSVQGHFYRGCTCNALQRLDEALAEFNTAIRLDPEFLDAYFQRAMALTSDKQYPAAIDDFTKLIESAATSKAYLGRAHVKILAGQLEQADEDFQEAIQLSPGEAEHFRVVQLLMEAQYYHGQELYDEAIGRADEALALDDQCVPAMLYRAVNRWYGNQFVEAAEDYTKAIEITGPDASSLNSRGQIYAELGEYELAIADLDRAQELCNEEDVELLAYIQNGRGLALTGLQRYDEAATSFEQSLLARPANAWLHYNHGLMYLAQADKPSAIPCFRLALKLNEPALRACQRARALGFLLNQQEESPQPDPSESDCG